MRVVIRKSASNEELDALGTKVECLVYDVSSANTTAFNNQLATIDDDNWISTNTATAKSGSTDTIFLPENVVNS